MATSRVIIVNEANAKDKMFAAKLGVTKFESAATGGDGTMVVYKAGTALFSRSDPHTHRTLAHEMAHNLSRQLYGSSKPSVDSGLTKLYFEAAAKPADLQLKPSAYGMSNAAEYYAESVTNYVVDRAKTRRLQPRLATAAQAELDRARLLMLNRAGG